MKLNLLSFQRIIEKWEFTVKRFPLASLVALMWVATSIVLIHQIDDLPLFWLKIFLTLILGFPLFVSAVLYGEAKSWSLFRRRIANSIVLVFLIIYYALLPELISDVNSVFTFRYITRTAGFFLLLTFIPFLIKGEDKTMYAFWRYNYRLATTLILTAVWVGAIQTGLSIAMGSISFLFDISIPGERYMELWILVIGVFSTTFFLSRIPEKNVDLVSESEYPKELRLFAQYILVPLVTIYFLILYAYVARILILWEWPKGTLVYMISGFSFLGILTYLSLYPLRENINWIKKTGTTFYIILIPQIGMLFWALWFRISQYSITENRYLVFVFGCWLLAMALYYLVSKKKDIRLIPATLFAAILLSSFGPWGAFAVSERSQLHRLEELLESNSLLVEGVVQKGDKEEISFADKKEVSAIIDYLHSMHGIESLQPLFEQDLSEIEDVSPTVVVEDLVGVEFIDQWQVDPMSPAGSFNINTTFHERALLNISEYEYMVDINLNKGEIAKINGVSYKFDVRQGDLFVISTDKQDVATIELTDILDNHKKGWHQVERDNMKIEHENESVSLLLLFENITGDIDLSGKKLVNSLRGSILFSTK